MKKLDSKSFQEIRTWIYQNARHLELTTWQCIFEKGGKEAVLSALSFYQNEDGGFGNAIEADSWNPESTPYSTSFAVKILKTINYTNIKHPIYQEILRFLGSGIYFNENSWFFNIPSNNNYAHAPWWTFNGKPNETEGIGLTAEITGFLIRYADRNSGIFEKALKLAYGLIEKLKAPVSYGDIGIGGYCILADAIEQSGLKAGFDCEFIRRTLKKLVHDSIERDTSKWQFYGVRPSNYITSPDSIYYRDNENIVQTELDYLIDTIPAGDVWGITWSWFDNNEKYAKEFAISENWWKSYKAIEKLIFLRNFNRLE